MTTARYVTAVRPYQFEKEIRRQVFAHIDKAGLVLAEQHIISPGTPDDEALAIVSKRPTHVLLVPFHSHRDTNGERVTGLGFLKRMDREAPELAASPVLMPVTTSAEGVVDAYVSAASGPARVLVLPERRLPEPTIADEIRRHVERWPAGS